MNQDPIPNPGTAPTVVDSPSLAAEALRRLGLRSGGEQVALVVPQVEDFVHPGPGANDACYGAVQAPTRGRRRSRRRNADPAPAPLLIFEYEV